jgi:hypothetical protein
LRRFQDQVYEDFKTKYMRTLVFSFQSNEASYLEHLAPKFFIYSVELELHDRNVCLAHLCLGLTRIDLSSLENLRSIWVVIIGLELLSLACPCVGLGRNYATSFILVAPYHDYGYFYPISVENKICGDGNGTCRCDADSSRHLSGAMLEGCG